MGEGETASCHALKEDQHQAAQQQGALFLRPPLSCQHILCISPVSRRCCCCCWSSTESDTLHTKTASPPPPPPVHVPTPPAIQCFPPCCFYVHREQKGASIESASLSRRRHPRERRTRDALSSVSAAQTTTTTRIQQSEKLSNLRCGCVCTYLYAKVRAACIKC